MTETNSSNGIEILILCWSILS